MSKIIKCYVSCVCHLPVHTKPYIPLQTQTMYFFGQLQLGALYTWKRNLQIPICLLVIVIGLQTKFTIHINSSI